MSFVAAATLGVGAISAGTSIHLANKQRKQQERLQNSMADPGIQANYGLMRSNEILADNYSNFELPGLTRFQEQLSSSSATAMSNVRQGATSSEDILAGAGRIQESQNQANQGIFAQQANGKLNALNSYIGSMNQVGNDQVRMNTMELGRYDATMREAAALGGAANQNLNSGIQDLLTSSEPLIQKALPLIFKGKDRKEEIDWSKYESIFG